jgi:hypothetical protein
MKLHTKKMSEWVGIGGATKWWAQAVKRKNCRPVEASWPVAAKMKMIQHLLREARP